MRRDLEQITAAPDGQPMQAQPAWRRDFPIDTPQDNYVARRDFTKFMVLTSLAFVAGHLWIGAQSAIRRFRGKSARRLVARKADVPIGGTVTFTYPDAHDPCLLLRTSANDFVAYSQKCTHLSCAVVPDHERGCLHCPCHNGAFEIASGRPIQGPPRRPLPKVVLEINGEEIYAAGVEERTV